MTPIAPKSVCPLDPRLAFVAFDVKIDDDHIQELAESEDGEHDERNVELARKLISDPREMNQLETHAMREVERKLRGAGLPDLRVVDFGHDDWGNVSCQVSVSHWGDVRILNDWVQGHMGGGDDVVYLETPFAEVSGFVLFPEGGNGRRFGPGEKDGSLTDWVGDNRPRAFARQQIPDLREQDLRVPIVVWDDGVELSRVIFSEMPRRRRTAEDEVVFEIGTPGRATVRILLGDFGEGRAGFPCVSEVGGTVPHSLSGKDWDKILPRVSWFLWAATPASKLEQGLSDGIVDEFFLPRRLPAWASELLADKKLEEDCLATHDEVARQSNVDETTPEIFKKILRVERYVLTEPSHDPYQRGAVEFPVLEGNTYHLFHGPLRQKGSSHEPPWSVYTSWVKENGAASWYVVNGNDAVVGAGRTPVEALRDVPYLVFPGEEEAWRKKRFNPGRFVFDPELYLLLDDWTPFFWDDAAFVEWYRTAEAG